MKYPLDKICVKSGVFCQSCQRKLDTGVVDRSEVDVMKVLMELEDSVKELRKGEYVKSYTIGDTIVILLRDSWERYELDKVSREVSRKIGKRVKIALDTGDHRRLVEQIASPAHVLGVNTIWLPDGSEQTLIRISRKDQRLLGDRAEWEKLFSKLLDRSVRIVFE